MDGGAMRIQQIDHSELEPVASGSGQQWLAAAFDQVLELPDYPMGRVLTAIEGDRTRAILGLELKSAVDDGLPCATIYILSVSPGHDRRGIGSRLVRFAEGIAHLNGCDRVQIAPELGLWSGGLCWLSLGYDHSGAGFLKDLSLRYRRSCA